MGRGSKPKEFILRQSVKLNWNFQCGGEVLEKIPFMGEVWNQQFLLVHNWKDFRFDSCSNPITWIFFILSIPVSLTEKYASFSAKNMYLEQ